LNPGLKGSGFFCGFFRSSLGSQRFFLPQITQIFCLLVLRAMPAHRTIIKIILAGDAKFRICAISEICGKKISLYNGYALCLRTGQSGPHFFSACGSKEFSFSFPFTSFKGYATPLESKRAIDPGGIACPLNEVKGHIKIPCCRRRVLSLRRT